jgi:hypothetical protein
VESDREDESRRPSTWPSFFFGVDTIRLTKPLAPPVSHLAQRKLRDRVDRSTGEVTSHVIGSYEMLSNGTALNIEKTGRGVDTARLEFSVPKLARGHNVSPSSVEELRTVVAKVWEEAADLLGIENHIDDLRIARLDVARDFRADGAAATRHLETLSQASFVMKPPVRIYPSSELAGVQTLTIGTNSNWQATLYNKEQEVLAQVKRDPERWESDHMRAGLEDAADRMRYELRLRHSPLHRHGIRTVADLNDERLFDVSRHYWDRLELGRVFALPALKAAFQAAERTGDGGALGAAILALLKDGAGIEQNLSRNTVDRHRTALRRYSVDEALLSTTFSGGDPHHFDFESGTLTAE